MKFKGIELQDAGYKPDKSTIQDSVPELSKSENIRYASFSVDDREIPAIKDKNFADECVMVALVKVTRKSIEAINNSGKKETRTTAGIDILKAGFAPYKEKKADEMNDQELNDTIDDK